MSASIPSLDPWVRSTGIAEPLPSDSRLIALSVGLASTLTCTEADRLDLRVYVLIPSGKPLSCVLSRHVYDHDTGLKVKSRGRHTNAGARSTPASGAKEEIRSLRCHSVTAMTLTQVPLESQQKAALTATVTPATPVMGECKQVFPILPDWHKDIARKAVFYFLPLPRVHTR